MIESTVQVLEAPRSSVRSFLRWVAASCAPGDRVLDVGAGVSRSGALTPLTRKSVHLVGVDPDAATDLNGALEERHVMSLERFAPAYTRVAYGIGRGCLMEHLSLRAVKEDLRPRQAEYSEASRS